MMRLAAIAAGLFALLPAGRPEAQSGRSLTDSETEILLAQGVTITVPQKAGGDDAEAAGQLALLRSTVQSLTESLAAAKNEAEAFKRQAADLALEIESLGIPAVEKNQSKLEQRLLAAVRDLRLLKKQQEETVGQLLRLAESVQVLLKSSPSLETALREPVEAELRKTSEVLGNPAAEKAGPIQATLSDGMIVEVKPELALVVANIGEKQGVQIGMPFQVWRESKRIGLVRVVDVRERISGAIIQSLESEKVPVKTGDRLKVDAKQ